MRIWAAPVGVILVAYLFCAGFFSETPLFEQSKQQGKSYISQAGATAGVAVSNRDYDATFGDNWDSVRTFRLMTPLERPLKVYVESAPVNAALYRPQYTQYVAESMMMWNKALDGRLRWTFTDNRKAADITVDWVSGFDDRYIAGVTTYSIGHAAIEIRTVNVPDQDIKGNIIHEIGHSLGISGHSKNQADIMVGMRRWQRGNTGYVPQLSAGDIQAIRRLYSPTWKRGEDLYATLAQTAVIPPYSASGIIPVAANPTDATEALQPAVLKSSPDNQAKEQASVLKGQTRRTPSYLKKVFSSRRR